MRILTKIHSVILAFLLLAAVFASPCLCETGDTVIRVGYIDYSGFIEKDSDGVFTGYGVDYLNEISKHTGYRYEFIYGQWTELLEMLKNKQIDILCTAQYTDERAEEFDYSAYPIGYTQGLLYTLENSEISYEDFKAFNNMRIGELKGSAINSVFDEYAKKNQFSYLISEYDTDQQMIDDMNAGKIDAICSEHLANHTNLSLISCFGSDAYYIISYKNSPYIDGINFALQQIKTDPDFETELYHKYYDSSAAESMVQFTSDEKSFIESSETFTVGLMSNRSPLSYIDKNGEPAGMMVDLMNIISDKTGLKFRYGFLEEGQTGFDFMSGGEGDLVAGVASSAFSTPNVNLLQSDTLQVGSIVFVGREGSNFSSDSSLTVAIPAGFINGEKVIASEYPNFTFYKGTDNNDCLKAVRDGKADVMLQNMYIIRECLQSPVFDGLSIYPAYSFEENEKIVTLPKNKILISIINKAIATISAEQANNIVINNTIVKTHRTSAGELIYKYRFPLIGIAVLFIAVITMFIAIGIVRRKGVIAIEKANLKLEESNRQMADAVIQADRANTAKSQFLSRMSHEIRTPMNAIVGLTTIAKRFEGDAGKIDDCLSKIETSSKVLLNIINDVLDMSAIESDKLKIANEKFDIKQILTGITTIYYPQCENKGIKFKMTTNLENEMFVGDCLRVSQILLNLVSNAYKFTESGGTISISVTETEYRDETAFIRFTVADSGIGMSKDMINRLFKPFEQETADIAQSHGGSGLGLSIAKNLIDMMHGAIKAESEKGKGTTFIVDIPFKVSKESKAVYNEHLKNIRVLVVDNDETSLQYASALLKRIGVPFDIASSGKEALRFISQADMEEKSYDVVMIDWKMPGMDGVELTRKIRSCEKIKTSVIIVSAYDLNQIEDEAREAGADHFVSKPLFQSTVFNVLMSLSNGTLHTESDKPLNYDFTGHRVLLAEDNELNAEIASELLDMVNMGCDHASDGKAALSMFRDSKPGTYDAILMDVQMPEMDGYEATQAIRALNRPDAKTIPIYAMTANAFNEDVSKVLSAGMNGHIAKPIDTEILYEALDKAVRG